MKPSHRKMYEEDGCWIFYGKRMNGEWYFYVSIEYGNRLYHTTWYDYDEIPHHVTKDELIVHLIMTTLELIGNN